MWWGRYDGLVEQLGGQATRYWLGSWIGTFDITIVVAANADSNGRASKLIVQSAPDVYFVNRGIQAEVLALVLTHQLRQVGVSVELDYSGASFGKQFRRADRCRAVWALIIGDLRQILPLFALNLFVTMQKIKYSH